MSKKLEYVTLADGWVADKWRAKGSVVPLTEAQAKYENVVRNTTAAIEGHAKARAASKAMAEADREAKAEAKAKAEQEAPAKQRAAAKALEKAEAKADAETNPEVTNDASDNTAKGSTGKK